MRQLSRRRSEAHHERRAQIASDALDASTTTRARTLASGTVSTVSGSSGCAGRTRRWPSGPASAARGPPRPSASDCSEVPQAISTPESSTSTSAYGDSARIVTTWSRSFLGSSRETTAISARLARSSWLAAASGRSLGPLADGQVRDAVLVHQHVQVGVADGEHRGPLGHRDRDRRPARMRSDHDVLGLRERRDPRRDRRQVLTGQRHPQGNARLGRHLGLGQRLQPADLDPLGREHGGEADQPDRAARRAPAPARRPARTARPGAADRRRACVASRRRPTVVGSGWLVAITRPARGAGRPRSAAPPWSRRRSRR